MKISGIFLVKMLCLAASMRLGPDGRYRQVTVRISEDIPDTNCQSILSNLKVNISVW